MAQRVQVMLVCDLHDGEVEGSENIVFGLEGRSYEIDLCEEHANGMRDVFAPYVGAGRRSAGVMRAKAGRSGRTPATSHGVDPAAVRAWARSRGIKVSERGRISAEVLEQYAAAGF